MTKRKKAALVADKVLVQGVLGNTVGRVGRIAGRLLLGKVPETAIEGSFQEEKPLEEVVPAPVATDDTTAPLEMIEVKETKFIDAVDEEDKAILEGEIFDQVFAKGNKAPSDEEREWKVREPEKEKELASV